MSNLVSDTWVSVGLPPGSTVAAVQIHPRQGCCYERLSPLELWLTDAEWQPTQTLGTEQCSSVTSVPSTAGPHMVTCTGLHQADYVTLRLPGSNRVLMVAELVVWGYMSPPLPPRPPPPSPPPPCPPLPSSPPPSVPSPRTPPPQLPPPSEPP
eukprot:2270425-Prymnesium_polylepis.1